MSLYLGTTSIASDGSHRLTGEIGDIGIAPFGIDESLNLRRYLNGQVISQTQFEAFTNKIKSAIVLYPNLLATEENWQAEVTNSKLGQCGKFVIDDEEGTIRLPKVVNIQGLQDLALIGGIKAESLPNITGMVGYVVQHDCPATGAFVRNAQTVLPGGGNLLTNVLSFDASRSSSTYQDGAPVQQEAVQYPYYIQVATGVEETLPAIREYKVNNSNFFGQSMWSDIEPNNVSLLASNGQYNPKTVYPDYYNWLLGLYNNPTESNVIKVGSIVDDNGVLSGFSTSNYVKLPSAFSPNFNSWEFVRKITTGNDVSTVQGLTDGVGLINVASSIDSSKSRLYLSSNGSTWDISAGILGTYTVLANTTYYVKISYNGSAYMLSYSTDGETYTTDITVPSSTPIYSNVTLELGAAHGTTPPASPFLGSIDLNESYININGQRWWNGRKAVAIKTGETSISPDYDYIINISDETFRLPLLNGERVLVAKKEATTTDPSWWNWYSDGWLEQGGQIKSNGTNYWATVTYLKPFKEEPTVLITMKGCYYNAAIYGQHGINAQTSTSTAFTTLMDNSNIPYKNWEACGYSSIPTTSDYTEIKGLYYYVGDVVQDASLINAGRVLEYFSKLNTVHCVIETFKSGKSWYRVYDDGWVEQGATLSVSQVSTGQAITLLKNFKDTNYSVVVCLRTWAASWAGEANPRAVDPTVSGFTIQSGGNRNPSDMTWIACGYGA
jgi:hypothetical protein